jgi:hypothetical protein
MSLAGYVMDCPQFEHKQLRYIGAFGISRIWAWAVGNGAALTVLGASLTVLGASLIVLGVGSIVLGAGSFVLSSGSIVLCTGFTTLGTGLIRNAGGL